MGLLGTLEYISQCTCSKHKRKRKLLLFQTVELKVKMDCDGCERKVKNAMTSLRGVKSVEINRKHHKVTVSGYVEENKVLKKAKSTGKKVEIWPYVPYNTVAQPYATHTYDKKAPPGYVKRVENPPPNNTISGVAIYDQMETFTSMFSDENPNACSVM